LIAQIELYIIAGLQTLFDRLGWLGVAGVMAFENATGILPSEIILGLAGWMLLAAHGEPPAAILIGGLCAALGSTAGASLTYWLARLGGRRAVEGLMRRFLLDPSHMRRAEKMFRRWGPGLVLVGRVIPGLRTWVTIPAGLTAMAFLQFFFLSLTGSFLWCTLLIAVGYVLGREWHAIGQVLSRAGPAAIAFLIVIGALALLVRRVLQRRLLANGLPMTAGKTHSPEIESHAAPE
jgi:membrane protein DedA with SNARE-associated domain